MDNLTFIESMREVVKESYDNSRAKGFWTGAENDNVPTKIALMHSELSEMLEAFRKDNPPCEKPIDISTGYVFDDETEQEVENFRRISSIEEEAADLFIRLCDFCGRYDIDLGTVVIGKMRYNANREFMHGNKKC